MSGVLDGIGVGADPAPNCTAADLAKVTTGVFPSGPDPHAEANGTPLSAADISASSNGAGKSPA